MDDPHAPNRTRVLLTPGSVTHEGFRIRYSTTDGLQVPICDITQGATTLTTLRSPSGSGKSTLLRRFVHCLRDNASITGEDLGFRVAASYATPRLAIGAVPQNPPFVSHWAVGRFLPIDGWLAPSAFGPDEWGSVKSRLMGQLSGGQQRRIYACSVLEELVRGQSTDAAVLVLDETLDGLGAQGAGDFLDRVSRAWQDHSDGSLCVFLVTHLATVDTMVPERVKAALTVLEESQSELDVHIEVTHEQA